LSEGITLLNVDAGVRLAGTLTLPEAADVVTAVLLVPGSGAQDRDEALCGHRPFLVLADHLTRWGSSVLRLDDRGAGESTGEKDECTHADLLTDVRTALDFLSRHHAIDPARVGLIGHSEGACLAAAAAARFPDIAFVVLMACGTGIGEHCIHDQSALIARAAGATQEQIDHERRMNEAVFAILKSPLDRAAAGAAIRPIFAEFLRSWPDQPTLSSAEVEEHVERMAGIVLARAFRSSLTCDFSAYLRQVHCPVLAMYGELDLQVPPGPNLPRLREALEVAGNTNVAFEVFPGVNHLFQRAKSGALSEYEEIEETIAPVVLNRITDWIGSLFDRRAT
jgi:pimeloyl-ACP methyl ester carboxylesterase